MSPTEKTLHDLEWPQLLEQLSTRCTSDEARARARVLAPAETLDEARARARRTAEALSLWNAAETLPYEGIPPVAEVIQRIARQADASSFELHAVRQMLRVASALRRFGHARRATYPALAAALASDPGLDRLLGVLDHAIDTDGTLADRASHDLAAARRRVAEARARVVARLDEAIERYAAVLQDRFYTLRDGRYVLPVRADAHMPVPGIVHGSSSSGQTLFIEPRAVVTVGNMLKVAQAEVEREEALVLADLSRQCRDEADPLHDAHEACLSADLLVAIVRLAHDLRAVAIEPEAEPVLDLRRARHPLLALAEGTVVPNDLSVEGGRVLVVSGPNAGGKTVALKTLGLAALMVRAGLPLPVEEGSRVGWFDPVACDVGDDQSIARNLSTFSAHVTHLAEVLRAVGPGGLVLLDELAGGTDPEEGAALAAAVLESLASRGAAVAVTTHYELLKTLALRDPRFVNASVGFDLAAMAPTFTVTLGIPGASSALAVARRYGIPGAVVARAEALLPEHAGTREDVLRKLQDEERAARMARSAAEEEARVAARLRSEVEAERNALRARENARLSRDGEELFALIRKAREELREVQGRLRKKKLSEEEARQAERELARIAAATAFEGPIGKALERIKPGAEKAPARRPAQEDELRPGARVWVPRLNAAVDVIDAPSRGQVRVKAGGLKLTIAVSDAEIDLSPQEPERDPRAADEPRKAPAPYDAAGDAVRPMRVDSNTCDVRGLRVDDALSMVDAFLDRLLGEDNTAGFVLHGHGTGALKSAVREHLKRSPYVSRSRAADPEDGGDAFTVLWIKA
jgi:DNA mismatch repair protein MutS2